MGSGNEDGGFGIEEAPERRTVEVVPVQVRDVNVIWLKVLNKRPGSRWVVPPGPPVAAADQPRVDDDGTILSFDQEPCVAKDGELHRHLPLREQESSLPRREVAREISCCG